MFRNKKIKFEQRFEDAKKADHSGLKKSEKIDDVVIMHKSDPEAERKKEKTVKKPKFTTDWYAIYSLKSKYSQLASACSEAMRMLTSHIYFDKLYFGTSKTRPLCEETSKDLIFWGIISQKLPDFKSAYEISDKSSARLKDSIMHNIDNFAELLVYSYFFEENDLHGYNWGLNSEFDIPARIDFNQTTWPIMYKTFDIDAAEVYEKTGSCEPEIAFPNSEEAFIIDIRNLPSLAMTRPMNWIDQDLEFRKLLAAGFDYNAFQLAKFNALLKLVLLPPASFTNIGNAFFVIDAELRGAFVNRYKNRQQKLKNALLKMPEFRAYMLHNKNIKIVCDNIIKDFQAYNLSLKDDKAKLTIDDKYISSSFDGFYEEVKTRETEVLESEKLQREEQNTIVDALYEIIANYITRQINWLEYSKKKKACFEKLKDALNGNRTDFKSADLATKRRVLNDIIQSYVNPLALRVRNVLFRKFIPSKKASTQIDWEAVIRAQKYLLTKLRLSAEPAASFADMQERYLWIRKNIAGFGKKKGEPLESIDFAIPKIKSESPLSQP